MTVVLIIMKKDSTLSNSKYNFYSISYPNRYKYNTLYKSCSPWCSIYL